MSLQAMFVQRWLSNPIKIDSLNPKLIDNLLVKVQLTTGELESLEPSDAIRVRTRLFTFSLFIHLFNVFRNFLYLFLPNDENLLKYCGDLTQYFVSKRYLILFPFLSFSILSTSMVIIVNHSPIEDLQWLRVISVIKRLDGTDPQMIGIYSHKLWTKFLRYTYIIVYLLFINITVFTTLAATITPLWLAIANYSLLDCLLFGMVWVAMDSVWAFYCSGVGMASFSLFLIVSHHMKLRVRQVNRSLDVSNRLNSVTESSVIRICRELSDICQTQNELNRFWSKYLAIVFSLYIPTNAFLLYDLIYESLDFITYSAILLLFFEISVLVFMVVQSGGALSSAFQECHSKLCSLYIRSETTKKFKVIINNMPSTNSMNPF